MSYKINIELTSQRPDGIFTWRVKGAKNPKGVVSPELLPENSSVKDELIAEVEYLMDGVSIIRVDKLPEPESNSTKEILRLDGPAPSLEKKAIKNQKKGPRKEAGRRVKEDGDISFKGSRGRRDLTKSRNAKRESLGKNVKEFLESLDPAHQIIARKLLRGGISALKRAIEEQNKKARESNQPELMEEPILKIADELLPRVRKALWLDKCDNLLQREDKAGLKDLRALITSAQIEDEKDRELLVRLRSLLADVQKKTQSKFSEELAKEIEQGNLREALELLSSPPDASLVIEKKYTDKLIALCNTKIEELRNKDEFLDLLRLILKSPIRRQIELTKLPQGFTREDLRFLASVSSQIPSLVGLLGIKLPPPPTVAKNAMSNVKASQ